MKLIIYTDGGARGNPGPAGAGVVIFDSNHNIIGKHKKYLGVQTNNYAEYQALILGLSEAFKLGAETLRINMDSELIVRQMQGKYKIKDPTLKILAQEVLKLMSKFKNLEFHHVLREKNKEADKLVNEILDELSNFQNN